MYLFASSRSGDTAAGSTLRPRIETVHAFAKDSPGDKQGSKNPGPDLHFDVTPSLLPGYRYLALQSRVFGHPAEQDWLRPSHKIKLTVHNQTLSARRGVFFEGEQQGRRFPFPAAGAERTNSLPEFSPTEMQGSLTTCVQ